MATLADIRKARAAALARQQQSRRAAKEFLEGAGAKRAKSAHKKGESLLAVRSKAAKSTKRRK